MLKCKKTFHLLGLAHLPTVREISTCAYTQKILKLAHMLMSRGHTVYFYGVEGSDVPCTEFIQCLSKADLEACYGSYDIKREFFKHDGNDACYTKMNHVAAQEINKRKTPTDFLLITMGNYQMICANLVQLHNTVESGIGYEGIFANFKVFESYPWMHYLYGMQYGSSQGKQGKDGSWYDCVIPNYFFPEDFPMGEHKGDEKGEYLLYMGRIILRKGIDIAVQVSRELGKRLIIAGQGSLKNPNEHLDIDPSREDGKHIEYLGAVGPEQRSKLLGGAICSFVPTYYIEPFGGAAVEAMMAGCPVLTSDWGAFCETVSHGLSGWRCRTFDEFVWAAKQCPSMDHQKIRDYAIANYSCERIAEMYEEYFDRVLDITAGKGWYQLHPERTDLNWLKRY